MDTTNRKPFTAAIAQMNSRTDSDGYQANLSLAKLFLEQASQQKADLIVLPEVFDWGYQLNPQSLKLIPDGAHTLNTLKAWSQEYQIAICAGLLEREGEKFYNCLYFITPDGVLGRYQKIHLFASPPTYEDQIFVHGNTPTLVQWNNWTLGLMICYDLRFPELARGYALQGAQGLILSSAWGRGRRYHFDTLMKARAIENQIFLLSSAQTGENSNGLAFSGGSTLIDPMGEVLTSADFESPTLLIAEVNESVRSKSLEFMNCLSHRIPQAYSKGLIQ